MKTISVLTSPDKKIRILTWYLIDNDGTHEHFGFLQAYNEEKERYVVYTLTDKWQLLGYMLRKHWIIYRGLERLLRTDTNND